MVSLPYVPPSCFSFTADDPRSTLSTVYTSSTTSARAMPALLPPTQSTSRDQAGDRSNGEYLHPNECLDYSVSPPSVTSYITSARPMYGASIIVGTACKRQKRLGSFMTPTALSGSCSIADRRTYGPRFCVYEQCALPLYDPLEEYPTLNTAKRPFAVTTDMTKAQDRLCSTKNICRWWRGNWTGSSKAVHGETQIWRSEI
ncbi:hypothetical protein B0H19DRAFT_485882 [Mycena capillaripes]|nr:hypothetical protein B0H19DRAFT_485882 [Mycena capillaripes]